MIAQGQSSASKLIKRVVTEPLRHRHALAFSRRFFGNNAGLEQNLSGRWDLFRARRSGARDPIARSFWQVGYSWVPGAYDTERFDKIQSTAKKLLNTAPRADGEYISSIQDTQLRSDFPDIFFLADDRVRGFVESIYGAPAEIYTALLWRTHSVPEHVLTRREVYSNHWHNDSGKISNVALFVLLTDAGPEHGPMNFVTRERTRELMRLGYEGRDHYGVDEGALENGAHVSQLSGKAGTALLLNTSVCLHRAGIPESNNTRDMVRIDFFPARR